MAAGGKIRLATRRSPLALRQAEAVAAALRQRGSAAVEIVALSTRGDEITDRPLAEAGGKALFVRGLQEAIAGGRADAAVHSLKDMEAQPTEGFTLAAVGFAADCRDVLVHPAGAAPADLLPGAVVGTCSPRRAALLRRYFPALAVKPIRGNLQTRLAKLEDGGYDALLLAAAGLQRLQLDSAPHTALPPAQFIPAVGQGLLGVECAADNRALIRQLAAINDEKLQQRAAAERAFAAAMQGDCHTALGAYATVEEGAVHLRAFYADEAGGFYQSRAAAAANSPAAAGEDAAAAIRRQM